MPSRSEESIAILMVMMILRNVVFSSRHADSLLDELAVPPIG
jgi:hypothetical protein